jgi:hypothetical protein
LIGKNIKVAVSRYQFDINKKFTLWTGTSTYSYDWIRSVNQVTLAWRVNSNFSAGTNLSFFDQNLYNPDKGKDEHQQTFYAVMGLAYRKQLKGNTLVSFGINIKNITSSQEKILVESQKDPLPVILYLGGAFTKKFLLINSAKSYPFSVSVSLTYQDLLNYKYKTGIRGGLEFKLSDLSDLQIGYYYVTLDDGGSEENKDSMSGITFGAGIKIPLKSFLRKVPVALKINVSNIPQPSGSHLISFDRTWIFGFQLEKI